jgi:nicotinamide-nucleotide amidase
MIAEIITIGDELLIGQIVNTNASFIASELNLSGIRVKRITTIADSREEILAALKAVSETTELVLITGGLGPTNDDITKKTLCEFFGSQLVLDEKMLADITEMFRKRGWGVSETNRRQAEVPHNCRPLRNPVGTAPGMWFTKDNRQYISMPGVPFEMKKMLADEILPELNKSGLLNPIIHKTILTIGIGESALADRIKSWEDSLPDHIKLAYLPEAGIVKLRLSSYTAEIENPLQAIDNEIAKLLRLIPGLVFGYGKDSIQAVVGRKLKDLNQSLSTAESCTGGTIAHLITSVPGSSAYYKGSVVAYDNAVKTESLGVDASLIFAHGAVSEEVVRAMAGGVKQKLHTDYAIATSGIAGPDGGTHEKPVGTTWIALATPSKVIAEKFLLGDDRERNISRASLFALNMLRKELEVRSA